MDLLIINEIGGQRQTRSVSLAEFYIGRSHNCHVALDSPYISAEHGVITQTETGYEFQNLSQNGSRVRGIELDRPGDRITFDPGDELRVGNYTIIVLGEGETGDVEDRRRTYSAVLGKTHRRLIERMDLRRELMEGVPEARLRERVRDVMDEVVKELKDEIPDWVDVARLRKEVVDEALGLGPLEDLLRDPRVTEIMVVSHEKVYVERNGLLTRSDRQFTSDEAVVEIIRRIVSPIGRRIDESRPQVDARLPWENTTFRVHAIISPLALSGPSITIRKFPEAPLTVENLIEFGTLSLPLARFLKACVRGKKNILVSGGTGSGKTTLLNVLSGFIGDTERIVTIEDSAELKLLQPHVVSLQARAANIEGRGAMAIRDLVINALRMRPDRIIVGECRSGEALDMLQAMNTGHDGSLTTGHANSPSGMMRRLETMVLMAGESLPSSAIREQIVSAIDLVVQMTRLPSGKRKITHVTEATKLDRHDGSVILEDIFHLPDLHSEEVGSAGTGLRFTGYVPTFLETLVRDEHLKMEEFFEI